jgi:hypothetical protein
MSALSESTLMNKTFNGSVGRVGFGGCLAIEALGAAVRAAAGASLLVGAGADFFCSQLETASKRATRVTNRRATCWVRSVMNSPHLLH